MREDGSLPGNANVEFRIRQAIPEDAPVAVPIMYLSGPAAFDVVFVDDRHRSAQDFLQYAFCRPGGEFGYTNHTVVTYEEKVVGIGACFSAKTSIAFMITVIPQIIRFYGIFRGLSTIRRGLQIEQLFQLPHSTKNYFAHLGVSPEWQSHGIGSQLVEHFLEQSRAENQTHATLDVSTQNPRAQMLYERIGFKTTEDRSTSLPGISPHRRMEMLLRPPVVLKSERRSEDTP